MMDMKTCAFTGHRPEKMPWGKDENGPLGIEFKFRLREALEYLIGQGYTDFLSGGARGFDMLAAEYMLNLRDRDRNRIRIISVLPFPGYTAAWAEEDRRRQEEIMRRSDKIVWVSPENRRGVYLERDRKLVDGSAYCICYCHRTTGGTAYTVRYARKQGIPVMNSSSWDLRELWRT